MSSQGNVLTRWMQNPKGRRSLKIIAPAVVIVLFLGSRMLISDNPDTEIPTAVVKKGDVVIKITEAGELRATNQATISAINDKQILWLAPEGAWVEKGDTLVIYESEKYEIAKGEAESNLQVMKSDLERTINDLESQKAREEAARQKYESLKELAKQGFAVESEVEQARLAWVELQSKTRSFEASVNAARANVQRAERALKQQERKLRQGYTLAPRAGLVVYAPVGNEEDGKKIEVGMIPFEGQDLMYLPDVSSMKVDIQINEVDLSRVKIGMPAEIRLDAFPDVTFKGEVHNIADLAKRKISRITGRPTGAKVFDVSIKVLAQDKRLKPGLSAMVDIIVKKYKDALYVPVESVFIDELERTTVFVKKLNGDIESRVVKLGESNDLVVVVLEGLEEGERVLLNRPNEF